MHALRPGGALDNDTQRGVAELGIDAARELGEGRELDRCIQAVSGGMGEGRVDVGAEKSRCRYHLRWIARRRRRGWWGFSRRGGRS